MTWAHPLAEALEKASSPGGTAENPSPTYSLEAREGDWGCLERFSCSELIVGFVSDFDPLASDSLPYTPLFALPSGTFVAVCQPP